MSQPPDDPTQEATDPRKEVGDEPADLFADFAREAEAAVDEAMAPLVDSDSDEAPTHPVSEGSAGSGESAASVSVASRAVPADVKQLPGSAHASSAAEFSAVPGSSSVPAVAKVLSFGDHQVRRLHERNVLLATRMRELVGLARENEQLSAHLHRLSIALLGADRLDEACGRVYTTLREDVGVEMAVIALYATPKRAEDAGLDELRAADDPVRVRFDHVFDRNLPVCGPLSSEAARELVGLRGGDFCSAALVPIGVRPFGLLALLSRDPERYHASMGKVVLRRMSELLAVAFETHLKLPGDV